jgi:hypothetical protein
MKKIIFLILFGLFPLFRMTINAQSNLRSKAIIGVWAMYHDFHPNGWGTWKKPYEYLEFKEDGKFTRTILLKKANYIIMGNYEVNNDSLIVFHESNATNGIGTAIIPSLTSRLFSVRNDELELWEDWQRILWKSIKKMGHKKKFRPLTLSEKENLELRSAKILKEFPSLRDTVKKEN